MTVQWFSLAIGSISGAILGIVGFWQIGTRWGRWSERQALTKEFSSLAGHYANYRVKDDGTHEPTGGIVEITWQAKDGLLEAAGFQANGHPEWHSYIKMSREYTGAGTGHYNNSNSIHGGIQQVIYSKQSHSFSVMGTSHTKAQFSHYWKRKD